MRDFDVLVLKVPTLDYEPEEIEAIKRFVERGGGLLLIGEHTDVFGTGRHLNSVAREFGLQFRHDCLFGIASVFDQVYQPPVTPHPIVQYMPRLNFATSGSIDPGNSSGRAAIRSTGLWSLPADYHADNYYPQVAWRLICDMARLCSFGALAMAKDAWRRSPTPRFSRTSVRSSRVRRS